MTPALPTAEDIDVIFTDVDGTLLQSDHAIHPRTLKAFKSIREKHPSTPVVICSGKQFASCLHLREQLCLPPSFPAAHCNGGIVHQDGVIKSQVSLPAETVLNLADGQLRPYATFLFIDDEAFLVNDQAVSHGEKKEDWVALASQYDAGVSDRSSGQAREDVLKRVKSGEGKVLKMTCGAKADQITEVYEGLLTAAANDEATFSATRAIDIILEIVPLGMNKAVAVKQICEMLGTTPEKCLAFGDGDNDKEMLALCKYGVSMDNAMPTTTRAATYSTLSNNEGGVGAFLEKVYAL